MGSDTNGAELLDDVRAFIGRFVAFPSDAALVAVTLWAVMTYMVEYLHATPRLALLSPEPGSGKTRVLEVLALLVRLPMLALNASPAAIFRTLALEPRTLLFDEVDAIWSKRGKDGDSNEDLRALLNSGYRRGATIPRCVGPRHEVQNFAVYAAAALAGLGDLPDTLMSRSIIIRMRRRLRSERVESFRLRVHEPQAQPLAERLKVWGEAVGPQVGAAWPKLPPGVEDRAAELWEPLIAVADAAGGHWPETVRAACAELLKVAEERDVSLGVRLLIDLRTVFGEDDAMTTTDVLEELHRLDEAPWGDLYGKPLQARNLARMLKQYEVKSTKVKVDGRALQGYRREDLWEAWERYAPTFTPAQPEPPEPPAGCSDNPVHTGTSEAPVGFHMPERGGEPPEPTEPSRGLGTAPHTPSKGNGVNGSTAKVPEVPFTQPSGDTVPQVPQVPEPSDQAEPQTSDEHETISKVPEVPFTQAREGDLTRRAANLAERYSKLPIETLRIKYQAARERATAAPTWWHTLATTESLPVTIALELLATDQEAGTHHGATSPYLKAARNAVAALKDHSTAPTPLTPTTGAPT